MTAALTDKAIAQLRNAGLTRPRAPYPGQVWTPRTEAEQHLLSEGYRLDRLRLVLLEEVGRLRGQMPRRPRGEVIADAARTIDRLKDCPLSQAQLGIVAAAAAGESPEGTARRLCLSYDTVKSHRQRAVARLEARNILHAVALCVAAGWITDLQITQGVSP
ncbi:helix-turn-helix transcriptional regulator [Streptomyces sp. S.PB5]|uniref:LuxR C-terminal-related transcriptional regulator n=1 Tax=Streptomyces sp. S.PB5 TaxID=3020844 RepID=UPI0025B05A3F|nr:helix-turn-helix transcriptional regulator [Streptomyces sp. S.PB5]MDN3021566.1 helix-turn-helix transcriptional regulator [Streptomyces sp. S.PB5]